MQVNMLEAKNQLSRLVKAAQAGEEVIIANHGVPAVRLLPVANMRPAISLADELTGLRVLLNAENSELTTPPRADRLNDLAATPRDEHAAD
jgi:prevent-host-death family protein